MIFPPPNAGPRSSSGARRGGDEFQDLFVWAAAMQLIRSRPDFASLEVERLGNGNFDDVVLRAIRGCDRLGQVKWSTNAASPFGDAYLTSVRGNGTSILQKTFSTFTALRTRDPLLEIITNRAGDPSHALLGELDGRTNQIPAHLAASGSKAVGTAIAAWAKHVSATPDDVWAMLGHLHFRLGRDVAGAGDRAAALMEACGLRHDATALELGLSAVKDWVIGGRREVSPADVLSAVDRLGLRAGPERAVLLIQALDWDPSPEDADEVLTWVDHFAGDSPRSRILPVDPAAWAAMQGELAAAVHRLEGDGNRSMLLKGTMRQATFFLVGALAPRTRDWSIRYTQRAFSGPARLWDTEAPRHEVPEPVVTEHDIGQGADIAVAVGVAADLTADVTHHLTSHRLPIGRLLSILPHAGPHDQSLPTPGRGVAFAQLVVGAVRTRLAGVPVDAKIHLFLAGPGGFAMVLGNRWNRLRETTVYEHRGAGLGYEQAFTVD